MKLLKKILIVSSLVITNLAHAQLPVIDGAALAKWVLQIKAMKDQLEQLTETNRQWSGTRGMEDLVNNPQMRRYLPSNYQQILNSGFGNSQQIREQYKRFGIDQTKIPADSEVAKHFNDNANFAATNRAAVEEAYRQASRRFDDLDTLLNQLKRTKDPKDAMDLQVRIQAEQAILQNEANKMNMFNALAQAQDRLQEQQAKELQMKMSNGKVPKY
ncbi:P-type DNA transfer protein VirB5 [Undibacterium sp. SXout7W]|uniref:P-type DNA transfer protein VirB5 n=1 Tax=Undibacterium sp. SXout7W TaxID=3413049 RepID=UPI003BF1BCEC